MTKVSSEDFVVPEKWIQDDITDRNSKHHLDPDGLEWVMRAIGSDGR